MDWFIDIVLCIERYVGIYNIYISEQCLKAPQILYIFTFYAEIHLKLAYY